MQMIIFLENERFFDLRTDGWFMVRIRDPLHGTVELNCLEERLIDSPPMQRLRGIRQLAMAYLVYPGANHTRFEHSIGTLFLADKICREAGLNDEERMKIRASALLHDVGHVAFSHESEAVLCENLGTHEEVGKRMVLKGELGDILSESFSRSEIAGLHDRPIGGLIASDIGADRMDYLLRDSHYTGVAYGVIDSERLCSSIAFSKGVPVLTERGLEAAESLLVARFMMFSTVYLHKTVRIASRMLQQAISCALSDGTLEACHAIGMSDARMLDSLMESKDGRLFAKGILLRRLFKKAHSVPIGVFSKLKAKPEKLERELSEACGCSVLLDIPRLSTATQVKLLRDGKEVPLNKASELVASLQKTQVGRLDVIVVCEEKNSAKVRSAAEKLFRGST